MNEAGSIVQDNSVDNGEGTVAERIGQWETLPLKDRVTQLFQLFDRLPNDNDAYICELYTIVRLLQAPDTTARLHGTSHLKDLYTDWANNTMFSAKWERELEHNGRPFTIPYGHLVWRSPASQTVKQDIIARQLMRQCKEYDDAAKAQRFIHMDIEAEERDILHGFPGRHPHQKWSQTQRLKQIKSDMHNLESSIDGIVHGNDSKMSLVIPLLIAHATTNFGSPKWDQYSRYWLQWVWGDQGLKKTLEDRSPIDHILEIRKAAAAATLLFETAVTSWIKNNYFNKDEAELLPRYYVLLRCHHLHTNNLSDYLEFFEGCDDPEYASSFCLVLNGCADRTVCAAWRLNGMTLPHHCPTIAPRCARFSWIGERT